MKIVFQNQHWVVCDKAAGVLTTPARFQDQDSRTCLGLQLQQKLNKQIFPVHRLDFEVSGLVLFALDAKAHAQGNFWFENRLVGKAYMALTEGSPEDQWKPGQQLHWKNKLLRGKKRAYESPHGKISETIATWQGWHDERMLWHLCPLTGRPHQLRVHLFQNGFPIVGDQLYGSTINYKKDSIALKSVLLDFSDIENRLGLPDKIQLEVDL
jgi:tRNA pseudouridine32 synthase/23S rRNA pseudouridine746 synthase